MTRNELLDVIVNSTVLDAERLRGQALDAAMDARRDIDAAIAALQTTTLVPPNGITGECFVARSGAKAASLIDRYIAMAHKAAQWSDATKATKEEGRWPFAMEQAT
jgi:hypothetical protein